MAKNKSDIVSELNKMMGKDIAFYGDDVDTEEVEVVPTGMLPLDWALGAGGLPKGRIIDLFGLPSAGKSSLCLGIIANAQKNGKKCVYIDAEYCFDSAYAKKLGVDTSKLMVLRVDCGEEAFEAMDTLIREKEADIIVVDSISALVPKSEMESEVNKPSIGTQAKLISNGIRRMLANMQKSGTIVIFINQLRMNIMGGQYDPYITTGGMALRFYASVRMEVKRVNVVSVGEEQVGYVAAINIKKNKVGRPGQKCETTFLFDEGFSAQADIIELGVKSGIVVRTGNSYFYDGNKIGNSIAKARDFLKENPELSDEILEKITSLKSDLQNQTQQ